MTMLNENDKKMGEVRQDTLCIDTDTVPQVLSGHRPIVFSDEEMADVLLSTEEMDVLLMRDNRIVASTAREGRYAAGRLFYARSPRQYAELLTACRHGERGAPTFLAFAHHRGIALLSEALLSDTELLLVVVLHGNVKRIRRVVRHCFADIVTFLGDERPEGGLRRGDEALYRGLGGVIRLLCRLLHGCGSSVEITERGQLISLLQRRMREILRLLPDVALIDGDGDLSHTHYPCLGTVSLSHTVAALLCLLLGANGCFARCTLRMEVGGENMYPQLLLTVIERLANAPLLDVHPAMVEAMRLSLRGMTRFECFPAKGAAGDWQITISPMRARYGEMYTLRSEAADLQK